MPYGGGSGSSGTAIGTVLNYTEQTSPLSVTATTEGTAQTFVTTGNISFSGTQVVLIEFYSPQARPDATAAARVMQVVLLEDATVLGQICSLQFASSGTNIVPLYGARRRTPSAGTHSYTVAAFVNVATGIIGAGVGGSGTQVPGYISVTQVA